MGLKVAVSGQALSMMVTGVACDLIASANNIVSTITFRAATAIPAVRITGTGLVTVEKVSARISEATSRIALEIVVAGILCYFLPVEAF